MGILCFEFYYIVGRGMEFLPLVDFIFETNPLKKPDIDQCITAICQPLEIIYDAVSVEFTLSALFAPALFCVIFFRQRRNKGLCKKRR